MSFIIQQNNKNVSMLVASVLAAMTVGVVVRIVDNARRRTNGNNKGDIQYMPWAPIGLFTIFRIVSGNQAPFHLLDLAHKMKRYSFRVRLPIPGGELYIIADPKIACEILKDAKADKPTFLYRNMDVISETPSIFTSSSNAYWKMVRKGTAHAFSSSELARMVQVTTACVQAWMKKLDDRIAKNADDASFDPLYEMVKLTFEIICRAGFEYSSTDEEYHAIEVANKIILRELNGKQAFNPLRRIFGFFLPEVRDSMRHCQNIRNFGARVLQTYRENANKSPNRTLIRLIAENPNFPSDKERNAEILMFFFAGSETTGLSLATTLVLLAKYPRVAEKLRAELKQCPLSEDWPNVEYFKCVVKESMRIMPVAAAGIARQTGRNHVYQGELIPKGVSCLFPFIVMFRNESVFQNPDEFIPERWLDPTEAMKEAFIPFAIGNRNCSGQALAKVQMDALLPALVMSYDLGLECEGEAEFSVTLKYAGTKLKAKRL